jgi:hypothetical protein
MGIRTELLESAADVFGAEHSPAEPAVDARTLLAKIGELKLAHR